ncbi:MAG: hypothetical protein LBB98_00375 [Treponema sp.]|jgi:hypothetical protein|nr:hypothetical protein [Treponema sp.]
MSFFEDYPSFQITGDIKPKFLAISPVTIDRALRGDRKKLALKDISSIFARSAFVFRSTHIALNSR